ncbi:hypothetical protein VNO77_27445 [Canavalia gladiata]|uniref:Uncharacterized protein n=1 Tax=Canavalia gladiata TaxID=3824 RepID=A0AAN9QAI3_CANGL
MHSNIPCVKTAVTSKAAMVDIFPVSPSYEKIALRYWNEDDPNKQTPSVEYPKKQLKSRKETEVKTETETVTKTSASTDYAFLLNQKIKKSSPQKDNVVTRF